MEERIFGHLTKSTKMDNDKKKLVGDIVLLKNNEYNGTKSVSVTGTNCDENGLVRSVNHGTTDKQGRTVVRK